MKTNLINNFFIPAKGASKKTYETPSIKTGVAEDLGFKLEDVLKSKYASSVRLGEMLNSGTYANVYYIEGWPTTYVCRIERDYAKDLNVSELISAKENVSNIVCQNEKGSVSIRKQIQGEPLHGRNWRLDVTPNKETFYNTINMIFNLPDEIFIRYMDDVINLREAGFDIDTWNPNNYLYDAKTQKINIVDINKNCGRKGLKAGDFYPFLDSRRLRWLVRCSSDVEKKKLADIVTTFMDRMIGLAKTKGYNIEIEKLPVNQLDQFYMNYATLLYRRSPIIFK